MRDGLKFSKALRKKIEEYASTEHFSNSKTGKQKLTRALDLVNGTNPEILRQLGINDIPKDPFKAMMMIRNLDEKTVKSLEIFKMTGKGKLTGHHGTPAAAIGRALALMKDDDREYVFKSLEDMYVKHGMDPAGILAVDGGEVHMGAHGGDWTGQRTGASLLPVIGERGKDFMKRFRQSYNIQMDFNEKAFDMPLTKDWDAAMQGGAEALGMKDTDLNSSTTPPEIRQGATKILKPTSEEVRTIVQSNPGNAAQIQAATRALVSNSVQGLNKPNRSLLQTLQANAANNRGQTSAQRWGRQNVGAINAGLIDEAGSFIKNNWKGEAVGALTSLLVDPQQRQRMMDGDYKGAGTNAVVDAGKGAVVQGLGKLAINALPKAVAPYAAGLASYVPPVIGGLALGEGLKANKRWRDENERKKKHRTLYGSNNPTPHQITQGKPQPEPQPEPMQQVQQVVDKGLNHLEYAIKNPLSIFGIK
jgi:hypothetical protein